jgi:hypothetical protein
MKPAPFALLVSLVAIVAACSDDKSYAVVSVYSGVHPIPNVAQLRVDVNTQQFHQQLVYPDRPRASTSLLQLDSTTAVTFSVSFRTMFKEAVTFTVEALDGAGVSLGKGTSAPQPINVGQVTYATVYVAPPCDPTSPATTCGTNQTCVLSCDKTTSLPQLTCSAAGLKNPGESCTDISDCLPGSECFEFKACSTAAQPRKTCRRFCNNDATCGSGSNCSATVACDGASTPTFKLCTRPCDPTGDATGGCAAGLLCFLYAAETTDCSCLDSSRAKAVGTECSSDQDCQPGVMCVDRDGSKTCQAICKLASPDCPTGTTCTALTSPSYKVFGACL